MLQRFKDLIKLILVLLLFAILCCEPEEEEPKPVFGTIDRDCLNLGTIELPEITVAEPIKDEEGESLGEFKITAYCSCSICCGKSDGITATGTHATEGRTIAVDPSVIPYGTKVKIGDSEYVAEDCGGAIKGKVIDIFIADHNRASEYGVHREEVFLID